MSRIYAHLAACYLKDALNIWLVPDGTTMVIAGARINKGEVMEQTIKDFEHPWYGCKQRLTLG